VTAPPDWVIERAREQAMKSPCAKSKRGVVIFDAVMEADRERIERRTGVQIARAIMIRGIGFNGPPSPLACDGSAECRRDCAKICLHAEHRALASTMFMGGAQAELVHVKVVNGIVVAGGPPSCWQCSREVLESGIRGVWLFENAYTNSFECEGSTTCRRQVAHAEHYHERVRAFCDEHVPWSGHWERCPDPCDRLTGRVGEWRFYAAEHFHRATLVNCGLHIGAAT
jgi:hypothetical protein